MSDVHLTYTHKSFHPFCAFLSFFLFFVVVNLNVCRLLGGSHMLAYQMSYALNEFTIIRF